MQCKLLADQLKTLRGNNFWQLSMKKLKSLPNRLLKKKDQQQQWLRNWTQTLQKV
jgi:hypothetical protein